MAATAAIGTDDLGAGQRIGPTLLLYVYEVELIDVALGKGVGIEVYARVAGPVDSALSTRVCVDARPSRCAEERLLVQAVALQAKHGLGVYACAVDHDGEVEVGLAVF